MLKILIAVDGSELALDAVRHALRLREEGLAAAFVLANVQEPPSLYEVLTVHDLQRLRSLSESAGMHCLQGARQLCDAGGVDYEFEVALGNPAHMLVDLAERYGCSVVFAGARGKGGLGSAALGQVAHELMHVSTLPVTIVKHADWPERYADEEIPETVDDDDMATRESEPQSLLGLA